MVSRVGTWLLSQRTSGRLASAIDFQQPLLLSLPVALLHRFALVIHLLAPRERQLDLGSAAAVEIERQRDEREALAGHRAVELGDFPVLEQQLPRPPRLMVEAVAVAIFGDMAVDQPDLGALGGGIALGNRTLALAERFHLGAGQLNSGLEPFLDEIVEARAAVFGHDLALVERLRKRLGHGA